MHVQIPEDVAFRLQQLVSGGVYPDIHSAAAEMIRRGLERERVGPRPPVPPEPYPDRPIQWHPTDVNWAP